MYGLSSIDGYDPMNLLRYSQVLDQVEEGKLDLLIDYSSAGPFRSIESLTSPILDLLGVRYLLTEHPIMDLGSIGDAGWSLAYAGPDAFVYRNSQALPPAFFVERWEVFPGLKMKLDRLSPVSYTHLTLPTN